MIVEFFKIHVGNEEIFEMQTEKMKIIETELHGVKIIEPSVFGDERGFFLESWNKDIFQANDLPTNFVQDNHSRSARNTVRGLHYQVNRPQGKLIRVIRGEAFDVAVDLRRSSPTFGQWTATTLSEENKRLIWIPEGFAHGCLILSEFADFEYRCTDYYSREDERTIRWDDSDLAIDWPLPEGESPVLSEKDKAGVALKEAETYA